MGFSAMRSRWSATVLLLTAGWSLGAAAGQVTVAVASNFIQPMKALAQQFRAQSGHQLTLAYGSSGKIFAQLNHGAPFDVFLSADQAKPEALETSGLALANSRFTYAIGALALWSPQAGGLLSSPSPLMQSPITRLAIANPRLAPYGVAAMETLRALDLEQQLTPTLVRGENIAQTYQFVASGNAQWGFVALSQVMQDGEVRQGSAWPVPAQLHQAIRQDAVMLDAARNNPAAVAFCQYLQSESARSVIRDFGYQVPTRP